MNCYFDQPGEAFRLRYDVNEVTAKVVVVVPRDGLMCAKRKVPGEVGHRAGRFSRKNALLALTTWPVARCTAITLVFSSRRACARLRIYFVNAEKIPLC